MILTWLLVPSRSVFSASGNASAKESRFATSFFEGRLRFRDFLFDFSIFEMNVLCLISRLSLLLVLNWSSK